MKIPAKMNTSVCVCVCVCVLRCVGSALHLFCVSSSSPEPAGHLLGRGGSLPGPSRLPVLEGHWLPDQVNADEMWDGARISCARACVT